MAVLWKSRLGDPHEGKLGSKDLASIRRIAQSKYRRQHISTAFLQWERKEWQKQLAGFGVSCWYKGGVESTAMWESYGRGVAIESTVRQVLVAWPDVECREVRYESYENRPATGPDPITVLSYKRPEFQHEHEIRFFLRFTDPQRAALESTRRFRKPHRYSKVLEGGVRDDGVIVRSTGVTVPVNLLVLIQSIRLPPDAPNWLSEAVRALTTKFGLADFLVHESTMTHDPYDDEIMQLEKTDKDDADIPF